EISELDAQLKSDMAAKARSYARDNAIPDNVLQGVLNALDQDFENQEEALDAYDKLLPWPEGFEEHRLRTKEHNFIDFIKALNKSGLTLRNTMLERLSIAKKIEFPSEQDREKLDSKDIERWTSFNSN